MYKRAKYLLKIITFIFAIIILVFKIYTKQDPDYLNRILIYSLIILVILMFSLYINYKKNKLDKTIADEKIKMQESFISNDNFECYIIVRQNNVSKQITNDLKTYQKIINGQEKLSFKIAEINDLTIVSFDNQRHFVYFFEILSSLQEFFDKDTIGYLKHKDKSKSVFVLNNHIEGNYDTIPCVTEENETGIINAPIDYTAKELVLSKKHLSLSKQTIAVVNELKNLKWEEIAYQNISLN